MLAVTSGGGTTASRVVGGASAAAAPLTARAAAKKEERGPRVARIVFLILLAVREKKKSWLPRTASVRARIGDALMYGRVSAKSTQDKTTDGACLCLYVYVRERAER